MGLSLITKAEYKAYAGLTSPTSDAQIDILVPKVSELAKSICRRTFVDYVDDTKVEYHDGGSKIIVPQEYPVINIVSLEYSADYGNTYTPLVEYTDYALSRNTHDIHSISPLGFPYVPNGFKLTYNAGFITIPEDLKLGLLDLVTYYIKNDMAVHSNKAPGTNTVQIEYVTNTNLPAHIKRVFDMYAANYN